MRWRRENLRSGRQMRGHVQSTGETRGRWRWKIHLASKKHHHKLFLILCPLLSSYFLSFSPSQLHFWTQVTLHLLFLICPHPILKHCKLAAALTTFTSDATSPSQLIVLQLPMPRDAGIPVPFLVARSSPGAPAPFLFLGHAKLVPASGSLPLLFLHGFRQAWLPLFTPISTQMSP